MNPSVHQSFIREESTEPGSDRTFGLVFAAALLLVGLLNGWHHGRLWPAELAAAAVFLLTALLSPRVLRPLNRLWMYLGLVLHRVLNPIVMGLLFYGTILPTGLAMRLRGRDLLRLKRDPNLASYWIARDPGPAPETMKDQF
jgi:Saxitoxin biosynthesis operon protein SxtJ